jgi:phosphoglycerate dehydrogenase-like enzyme
MTGITRVHLGTVFSEAHREQIRAISSTLEVTYQPLSPYEPGVPFDGMGEVEVLCGYHAGFAMTAVPKLRWLHLASNGANHLQGQPILDSDVLITNSRVYGAPIAEYVFASAIAFNRRFPLMHKRFQEGRAWPRNQWDEYAGEELAGKTLAIVGYGSIGRQVARVARAFDMRIVAIRRNVERPVFEDEVVQVHPPGHLRAVLAQGDVVVVCLPLTEETRGVIGEPELRAMKPTAYLVNVGRGKVVDDAALYQALKEGWIGGAGLDVWAQTPLPPDSPYFELDNVIMTPHMSGISSGAYQRITDLFCENLRRYLAGEQLLNVVDKQLGY